MAGAKVAPDQARRFTLLVQWRDLGALAAAARNSEDLNVVTSPEVAAAYAAHWRARLAVSVRFADASGWCER